MVNPIVIPLDAEFGEYTITLTDGIDSIQESLNVESDQVIMISTTMVKFERGENIAFEGTALPDMSIVLVLEDPFGNELISEDLRTDKDGNVKFNYTTTRNTPEGTYTLIATQGLEREFIYAGLGQLPEIPVNVKFDKLNYDIRDVAIVTLTGQASDIVSLLILDPFDKPTGNATSITLEVNGKKTHRLELIGFTPGIYTAIVSKGTALSEERFSVGLETSTREIKIKTTKTSYEPNNAILILGDTAPNTLLEISLTDPNGNVVNFKETYADKEGEIVESSFRIPAGAEQGKWTITARSGSHFDIIEIDVFAPSEVKMSVRATVIESPAWKGKTIDIHITGGNNQVIIQIVSSNDRELVTLEVRATPSGVAKTIWHAPSDIEPGIYTVKVKDAFRDAETTFRIG